MTFRELFKSEYCYDVIAANRSKNVYPCPSKFGYEAKNPTICRRMLDCKSCWEREVPDETMAKYFDIISNNDGSWEYVPKKAADAANSVREEVNDNVSHPSHYCHGGIECIDAIESATHDLTGAEAVLTGQVIKYLWRWKWKNGVEDLRKAKWYINRLIEKVEAQK